MNYLENPINRSINNIDPNLILPIDLTPQLNGKDYVFETKNPQPVPELELTRKIIIKSFYTDINSFADDIHADGLIMQANIDKRNKFIKNFSLSSLDQFSAVLENSNNLSSQETSKLQELNDIDNLFDNTNEIKPDKKLFF
jgi:hypothetical protein